MTALQSTGPGAGSGVREKLSLSIQRLIRIFSFERPSQALTGMTYDMGVCGKTG